MTYLVRYELDGVRKEEPFPDCRDVGAAFWRCARKHRGCKLIGATVHTRRAAGDFWVEYEPASTVKVVADFITARPRQTEMEL